MDKIDSNQQAHCKAVLRWVLVPILCITAYPVAAVQTVCNNNGGAGWPINDNSSTTLPINFTFADSGLAVDVDVSVDITHTYIGDLEANITSPNGGGTNVALFNRPSLPDGGPTNPPYGCNGDDILASFDDESPNAPMENATCGNSPAYNGSYQPHNAPPNDLSAFDGEDPTGIWTFNFSDNANQDTGTFNEACITVTYAGVNLTQWVSTNAICSDQLDNLNIAPGTNVYVCYTLSNPGDESFVLNTGDWSDDLGIDLSALEGTYNAGDSQTLNTGPFEAGNLPFLLGTTNAAASVTVTGNSVNFPPSQTLNASDNITATVTNASPGSASKSLYIYNDLSLSRVVPTAAQADITLTEQASSSWTLTPALQANLNIDTSSGVIPVSLYLREQGFGTSRDLTLTVAGSVSGTIATLTTTVGLTGTTSLYNFNLPIAGTSSLTSGESISFTLRNNTSGYRLVIITPSNGAGNDSLVALPSNTIINVDSIAVYDVDYATDPAATPISSAKAGDAVYFRSVISDPFGSFDITSASITITDPTPNAQVSDATKSEVADSATATKIYEYAYTIPAFPALGDWRIDVTANEGSEGTISHNNFIDFLIYDEPNLTVVKSANAASAEPGSTITYSITMTNSGIGTAHNVKIDDNLSPFIDINTGSFICSSGCPGSGLTLGTPNFTTDATGDIISWDMIMNGALNGNGASATVQYQGTVE